MAKLEEKIEKLISHKVTSLGYELYDVEYAKEGKDHYMRIYIDKPEGINIEDCEKVSNEINPLIDEANLVQDQYFLEVSSTGVERILRKDKHLKQNLGSEILVKLFQKSENGKKEEQGILQEFDEETITLSQEESTLLINRKNIAQIKTVYHWE